MAFGTLVRNNKSKTFGYISLANRVTDIKLTNTRLRNNRLSILRKAIAFRQHRFIKRTMYYLIFSISSCLNNGASALYNTNDIDVLTLNTEIISQSEPKFEHSVLQDSSYPNSSYPDSSLPDPSFSKSASTEAATIDPSLQITDNEIISVNPLLIPDYTTPQLDYLGLENLTYDEAPEGGGSVKIDLADDKVPVDIQRQGNKIIIRMMHAGIPSHLIRQHHISGGLVASIIAQNLRGNGVVTIEMKSDFEYQAFQAGQQVSIHIQPIKSLKLSNTSTLEDKKYVGKPVSLDFQNVEVRNVLHLLSQFTDLNIVASDTVSGSIMLNLINVPWDQALDIVLSTKNLGMRKNGKVILVAPLDEIAEQEAKLLGTQQLSKDALPLRNEYIRLNYANAEDVLTLISQASRSQNQTKPLVSDAATTVDASTQMSGSLLSNRGTVTVDARTNTLIIQDTADSIDSIRHLISKIDIPVRQVMIETRIVSANNSFSKEIGVRWGMTSSGVATNNDLLVGGSDQTLADLKSFSFKETTKESLASNYPDYAISRPDNLNVDLGIANPSGRIAFGLLSMSDLLIDLELSAMQAEGRGEIIATPKILTMDKYPAKVSSGTKIPYQSESESGGTKTQFVEAVLSLDVTPNITPEGKITLKLDIENGRPNPVGNGIILIDTDTLSTNVTVEDGQTLVLGGIYRNQIYNNVEKVPFFGDLPYLGRLFRQDMRRNDKQELLIFVTPRLMYQ